MSPHTLAEWIDARMSRAEFARKIGMSASHLSLVISGERGLSLRQAVAIEQATERAVSTADLLAHRDRQQDKARQEPRS